MATGVGMAATELLVLSGRSRLARVIVGVVHGGRVLSDKRIHADISADQRGVHVHGLGRDQPGLRAILHDPHEHFAERRLAPSLTDARERGVVRKRLVKAIPGEPADREIDLSFAHQPPILHDAEKKPGQHQPDGHLWINPWAAIVWTIKPGHLGMQPAQIKDPVHTNEHMILGQNIPQRPRNEKFQLITFLPTQHARSSSIAEPIESAASAFFNSPPGQISGRPSSFIAGLTRNTLIAPWVIKGAMNGPAFAAYVQKVLVPELTPGTVVILDNLATHRNAEAAEAIRQAGCWFLF